MNTVATQRTTDYVQQHLLKTDLYGYAQWERASQQQKPPEKVDAGTWNTCNMGIDLEGLYDNHLSREIIQRGSHMLFYLFNCHSYFGDVFYLRMCPYSTFIVLIDTCKHIRGNGGGRLQSGEVSLTSRKDLHIFYEGFLTAARYIKKILEQYVIPYASFTCSGFILMHDNERPHSANCVNEYLYEFHIDNLWLPAYSPASNPIELVWKQMKINTSTAQPTTNDPDWFSARPNQPMRRDLSGWYKESHIQDVRTVPGLHYVERWTLFTVLRDHQHILWTNHIPKGSWSFWAINYVMV